MIPVKSITREARNFLAEEKNLDYISGTAFLIKSAINKIIVNLFLEYNEPAVATKVFTNKSKATEWLMSF